MVAERFLIANIVKRNENAIVFDFDMIFAMQKFRMCTNRMLEKDAMEAKANDCGLLFIYCFELKFR